MLPEDLPEYIESIRALKEKYRNQISIKIGLEYEYFPEYIHWLKEIIKEYRLDYILFGNHHYHTDEKFPYFGHHTTNRDMLDLYEESTIEGMESGLFAYLAHPDLFMRSYPEFDKHCISVSRHICRAAARFHIPLEYNIGYVAINEARGITTYPCPQFWHIAANEGCTAIIGLDAHNNLDLENPTYYDRAYQELNALKMPVIDTIPFLKY
ncbi:putative histidinol-phosphatase [Bacteroides fragilis str. 3783N1-8]|nr:putative histidinol-phosphatase [Bacteroides fragilis str. 3783N1-8]